MNTEQDENKALSFSADAISGMDLTAESGLFPPPPQGDLAGTFGAYEVIRKLGEGGMGTVYLVRETKTSRQFALKTPKFCGIRNTQLRKRFQREALAASHIEHPNICAVHEIGEIEGRPYLTMPYIQGGDLTEWIHDHDDIPLKTALGIVKQVALGLEAAHAAGVVHRDLKPNNIMFDDHDRPIIMDFGMVGLIYEGDATVLTVSGTMVGTPTYMAPEQIKSERDKVGPATDVYSLGVIMYELLTGWPPFSGSLVTMLGAILEEPAPRLSVHSPDIDPALEDLCLMALAKEPADRYASAAELVAAIDTYLETGAGPQVPEKLSATVVASTAEPPTADTANSDGQAKKTGIQKDGILTRIRRMIGF